MKGALAVMAEEQLVVFLLGKEEFALSISWFWEIIHIKAQQSFQIARIIWKGLISEITT